MKSSVLIVATIAAAMAGCAIGPDYKRPSALKTEPIPASFVGVGSNTPPSNVSTNEASWQPVSPAANLNRGPWWELFGDEELTRLESLAETNNQSLAASIARLRLT